MARSLALLAFAAVLALAGGTATAETDAAPPEQGTPKFGYNEDWGIPEHLDIAAAGGANVARAVMSWYAVERRPGKFRWRRYDKLYERMLQVGTPPVWVLADAPCWAWAKRAGRCRRNARVARAPRGSYGSEWEAFVTAVVERYPQTAAVQTWNEPNLVDFWKPRPNPRRAARLAVRANAAVKRVNPEISVLFGGLAPLHKTVRKKGKIAYDEFLRDAYAAVGTGHWDAVAVHPFPKFNNRTGYLDDIVGHLDRVRQALADSNAAGTPIWVTEVGLSTGGCCPYKPHEQAEALVRIYRELAAMDDVATIIIHRLVDVAKVKTAEAGWGVFRANGREKPAYCALAQERGMSC
jgi:hypothetical protein